MKTPVAQRQVRRLCSLFAVNSAVLVEDSNGIYSNQRIRSFYLFCENRFKGSSEDVILDENKDAELHNLMLGNNMKLNRKLTIRRDGHMLVG